MTYQADSPRATDSPGRSNKLLLLLVALAVVLGLGATGGSLAYAKQFEGKALPGTHILGTDVSGMDAAEITQALDGARTNVTVSVDAGGTVSEVPLEDLGVSIDPKATAAKALERNQSMGSLVNAALSGSTDVSPVLAVDTDQTKAFASSLVPADQVNSVDAQVVQNEETKEFSVVPSQPGKGVDPTQFVAAVEANAPALKDFSVSQEFTDVEPQLSTTKAEETVAKINELTGTSMVVTGPDNKTFEITRDDRLHFLAVAPNEAGDHFDISVKQEDIDAYLGTMANEVEVTKKDGITEVSEDGSKRVISEKEDGLKITNKEQISQQVTEALSNGTDLSTAFTTEKVEAAMTEKPAPKGTIVENLPSYAPAEAHNGEKWIDVNLSNKTLTAYVGDRIVFGPRSIVDGKSGYETVTGTYKIYLRNQTQDLTNAAYYPKDHPKYYYQPDVPYVQYFHRGYAIHGAPWRSSFGYSGSHGCVNMTVADAKWMWDWASMGTTVVSHY